MHYYTRGACQGAVGCARQQWHLWRDHFWRVSAALGSSSSPSVRHALRYLIMTCILRDADWSGETSRFSDPWDYVFFAIIAPGLAVAVLFLLGLCYVCHPGGEDYDPLPCSPSR